MGRRLQAVDNLLTPAVQDALKALQPVAPEDHAVRRLALRYARAIDNGGTDELETFGPKLLSALSALGATPAARAKLKGGAATRAKSRLQALREARQA